MTNTVNDLFKKTKAEWLTKARETASKLLEDQYAITIEDVLEVTPLPKYLHRNTIGNVFKTDDFKPIGWLPSKRTAMHGRPVRNWTMKLESDRDTSKDLPLNWGAIRQSANDGDFTRIATVD